MSTDLATRYDDDDEGPRAGGEDLRQGIPISFNGKDGRWYRDGSTEIPIGSEFLLIGFAGAFLRWEKTADGKPQVERRNLADEEVVTAAAAERVRRALGHHDEDSWPVGLNGEPQDPWQLHLYTYLHDMRTGETGTYDAKSWSGRRDVWNLKFQISSFQRIRNQPHLVPLITLNVTTTSAKGGSIKMKAPLMQLAPLPKWHDSRVAAYAGDLEHGNAPLQPLLPAAGPTARAAEEPVHNDEVPLSAYAADLRRDLEDEIPF